MHDKRKKIGFLSVLTVLISAYLYTIAPTVSLWDCGEFIASAHILGVAHPPGTPFFTLLCRIFDIIIPFDEVAKRINLFSSLSSALAGGFLYLIILSVFQRFRENRGKKLPLKIHLIAIFSAIGAGLSYSVWDTSVETEVYSTSILILIIGLWLALHWDENREMRGDDNYLLLLIYLIFLSFGIHLIPLLLIPGILVFVIMSDRKIFNNPKLILFSIALILIGITTYYYLMIRSQANPAINEADPSNFSALWSVVSREQYGPMEMFPRKTQVETSLTTFTALFEQIKIFFKYFSWQYFPYPRESDVNSLLKYTSIAGTYIYVLIGLWGMFVHYKKDKKSFYLFFVLYLLVSLGLVFYLNLKFSPSDSNPAHKGREVRERDYFWTPAFFLFMFYIANGLYWIYVKLKKISISYGFVGITLAFLIGLLPLISNIKSHVNRRDNWIASDYAHNLLVTPEDYSILFTYGDNDTFPIWFLQEVKNFRKFDRENKKGIQVANFSLMNTNWYIKQLKAAGIPMDFASPFKGTNAESKYDRNKRSGKTNLGFEEWVIDNIQPIRCEDGQWIRVADIVVRNIILCSIGKKPTFKDFIMPADIFVDKYIKKSFNPSVNIYFSLPVEEYSREVFEQHLELEGFAFRLVGKKGNIMMNSRKMFDKLPGEFKTNYCKNPTIYTGEAQKKPLNSHAYLYLLFSNHAVREFTGKNRKTLSSPEKDTLRILESILKQAFIFSAKSKISPAATLQLSNALKKIYSLLGEKERATNFCDSLLSIINTPSLHLLRVEMLIFKAKSKKHNTKEVKKAIEELLSLVNKEELKPLAYKGLIEIYSMSDNSNKLKEIILEIRGDPKLLDQVIILSINFNPEGAIKLLENWKELYPYEAEKVDPVIKELKKRL
jgi:hypothetical protein